MSTVTKEFMQEFLGEKLFNELNFRMPVISQRCADNPNLVEFKATLYFIDDYDSETTATAYYYQTHSDVKSVEDLSDLDWNANHYVIGE